MPIRLAYIDAPESSQLPYGPAAGQRLKQLLPKGQPVSLRVIDTDLYGRTVAVVYANNKPVNLQMVREGYAVIYRQYMRGCRDLCIPLQVAEADAKRQRLNFWSQSNPVMPWDYRKS
jgi:micrococcal nuclease